MYLLALYHERVKDFANHSHLKRLHNEIGILRMMIEKRFEQVKDDHDLLLQSGSIADMITKVQVLVTSAAKLDEKLSQTLDKDQVLHICNRMIEVISNYIEDPDVLEALSEDLVSIAGEAV